MDDRAVSVLENYECKVIRTWKGRGSILCETDQGLKILKEYIGPKEKAEIQNAFVTHIKEAGYEKVEQIVKNKEGELLSVYGDRTFYMLKDYFEGKECNVKDEKDCLLAMTRLAKLHQVSFVEDQTLLDSAPSFSLKKEYEKHNKELKKARNYIRQKSQKTDFEIYLMKHYDLFYEKALLLQTQLQGDETNAVIQKATKERFLCHGDYQYHNILMNGNEVGIINFEKYSVDNRSRDVYLFMRKVLEKNNWNEELGQKLLVEYEKEYPLTKEERKQLCFRFMYPEKFWKIVNFYFNSGKAFISIRNEEKLGKLLKGQEEMQKFILAIQTMVQ